MILELMNISKGTSDSNLENTTVEYVVDASYQEIAELVQYSTNLKYSKIPSQFKPPEIKGSKFPVLVDSIIKDAIEANVWLIENREHPHIVDSILPICCYNSFVCKGSITAYASLYSKVNTLSQLPYRESFLSTLDSDLGKAFPEIWHLIKESKYV